MGKINFGKVVENIISKIKKENKKQSMMDDEPAGKQTFDLSDQEPVSQVSQDLSNPIYLKSLVLSIRDLVAKL